MAKELRPDIEAALDKSTRRRAFKELPKLPGQLADDEQVAALEMGKIGKKDGLLAVTDRRLLFIYGSLVTVSTEDVPLATIDSVEWKSGMIMGTMTVHARGREVKISDLINGKKIVDLVRARMGQQPAVAAPAAAEPDAFAQIERLGELRDKGLLSPEEFEAKKAELLGRL